jgi:hypothetical protein
MRFQIFLAILLFVSLSAAVFAQEVAQISDPESNKAAKTRLFDRYEKDGPIGFETRFNSLFLDLLKLPKYSSCIRVYRGADDLPVSKTEDSFQAELERIKAQLERIDTVAAFAGLERKRILVVDGGFRKSDSVFSEIWLVPEGGLIPDSPETISKSKTKSGKPFKVDEQFLNLSEAFIKKQEEPTEAAEQPVEENLEDKGEVSDEPDAENSETGKTEFDNSELDGSVSQETGINPEAARQSKVYNWTSNYFATILASDESSRGIVMFYADEAEYNIEKSRRVIVAGVADLAEKTKSDLSYVEIVFGGFRSSPQIEYWIVPQGAREPAPTPEQKEPEKRNSL